MRISILQTDIVWENKQENLRRLREKLETLRGTTEIVVLPETFSTGFSMDTASLAEPMYVALSISGLFCTISPTTAPPAVFTSS